MKAFCQWCQWWLWWWWWNLTDDYDDNYDDDEDDDGDIHPKSKTNGGDYLSSQKSCRKKCRNLDDKILRQKCVNHPNVMNFVTK